jgi:glycosyltransferase involved in cell wall biosynthesis
MRVGIDAHASEHPGDGNCTYTRGLIGGWLGLGGSDRFTLFARQPTHAFYASLPAAAPVTVHPRPLGPGTARIGWRLAQAARREDVDCLHAQYFAPFGWRRPLVLTVHDLAYLHVPDSFPVGLRLAMRVLVPWSMRRASRIITVSQWSGRDLTLRYPGLADRIRVIPNGGRDELAPLPPAETRATLARYGLEPGFVFSLGRLNRRKNLARLVQAHAALGVGGGVPLVIGGRSDHGVDRLDAALAGADPQTVRRVGLIPDADLAAFFSGAACFVLPSLFEGFGLPLLEAMACGCPVISSDRAALPEVVGDAGLLVDAASAEAIADALRRVLGDAALRAGLRERGLERSREFSWSLAARRTLGVMREAAAARQAAVER